MMADFWQHLPESLLWGLIATVAMTSILQLGQGLGWSRLSLPFLVGTMFTARRDRAMALGFLLYVLGGWLFAMLYLLVFLSIGYASWWLGAVLGALHGVFVLLFVLPLLPYLHPRMASAHEGSPRRSTLEPPGFLGLHYGSHTPLTTLLGLTLYGTTLGGCAQFAALTSGAGT